MDKAQTWKQWRSDVEREAKELEHAADMLEMMSMEPREGDVALGSYGIAVLETVLASLRGDRDRAIKKIRELCGPLREMVKIAMWLSEPARANILEVVSQPNRVAQEYADQRVRLTTAACSTITNRQLWRPHESRPWFDVENARIDRIVAGAHLYAATKKDPE